MGLRQNRVPVTLCLTEPRLFEAVPTWQRVWQWHSSPSFPSCVFRAPPIALPRALGGLSAVTAKAASLRAGFMGGNEGVGLSPVLPLCCCSAEAVTAHSAGPALLPALGTARAGTHTCPAASCRTQTSSCCRTPCHFFSQVN